jgi:hypothetical protein
LSADSRCICGVRPGYTALLKEASLQLLNDPQIRALKPSEKPRKVADAKRPYLRVMPSGEKIWRMTYFFPPRSSDRKEKTLTIGPYREISLREARDQRDEARRDLRAGIDPMVRRRAETRTGSDIALVVDFRIEGHERRAGSGRTSFDKIIEQFFPCRRMHARGLG